MCISVDLHEFCSPVMTQGGWWPSGVSMRICICRPAFLLLCVSASTVQVGVSVPLCTCISTCVIVVLPFN